MQHSNIPIFPDSQKLSGNEQAFAIASIVMNVIGLCLMVLFPMCNLPFALVGAVLAFLAWKDSRQRVWSVIALSFSAVNVIFICVVLIYLLLIVAGPEMMNYFKDL